jgi:hypothetical protein
MGPAKRVLIALTKASAMMAGLTGVIVLVLLVSGCGGSSSPPQQVEPANAVWDEFRWDEGNWG